ncbi:hypothetical protein BLOT_001921 [Blomia tropicalis]|nr:hypothetical protein BLOT_001921 [Blomia tropicalis]
MEMAKTNWIIRNFFLLFIITLVTFIDDSHQLNNRPIVGVLLQEQYGNTHQYVAASYVKFLEMAGARVVPIFVNKDKAYFEHLMDQINGVLMPGGGTPLIESKYAKAASLILDIAIQKNKNGIYFPVWGTCLSFEKLITYFNGDKSLDWESHCDVDDVSLPLNFTIHSISKESRMFRDVEDDMIEILSKENVTANYHRVCLTVDTFEKTKNLTDHLKMISSNTYGGIRFVSTIEHRKYPIYGTQWHPEKNIFEWVIKEDLGHINHNQSAILVGQYFGNFLVSESRKNEQTFKNKTEEINSLIYNFSENLVYSSKGGKSSFNEIYRFNL